MDKLFNNPFLAQIVMATLSPADVCRLEIALKSQSIFHSLGMTGLLLDNKITYDGDIPVVISSLEQFNWIMARYNIRSAVEFKSLPSESMNAFLARNQVKSIGFHGSFSADTFNNLSSTLESMKITDAENLQEHAVSTLFTRSRGLRNVEIKYSRISESVFDNIHVNCPNLTSADISFYESTNFNLANIGRLGHLTKLQLIGVNLNAVSLRNLFGLKLVDFAIPQCKVEPESALVSFLEAQSATLENICVACIQCISNETAFKIASACLKVKKAEFSFNSKLTDAGIILLRFYFLDFTCVYHRTQRDVDGA